MICKGTQRPVPFKMCLPKLKFTLKSQYPISTFWAQYSPPFAATIATQEPLIGTAVKRSIVDCWNVMPEVTRHFILSKDSKSAEVPSVCGIRNKVRHYITKKNQVPMQL